MNSDKNTTAQAEQKTKVSLVKAGLTFEGKERAVGDVIEVTDRQLARLVKKEFIADPAAKSAGKAGGKTNTTEG